MRAHLTAAAEFFYRHDKSAGRLGAARRVKREGKIRDVTPHNINDWRDKLSRADPETDIEANVYRRLTNPDRYPVPGYDGPMSDREYGTWLLTRAKTMGYLP